MRSVAMVCAGMLVSAAQAGPTLRLIGNPDGPFVIPFWVSGDGRVAGGYYFTAEGITAGVWTSGRGSVPLPGDLTVTGNAASVIALSHDGSGAGILSPLPDGGEEAFIWSNEGSVTDMGNLGGLSPTGLSATRVYAVTNDGQHAAGGSFSPGGYEAFVWSRSTGMLGLGDLGTDSDVRSYATWISGDGSRVRGIARTTDERYELFEWSSSGGMTAISDSLAFGELDQVLSTAGDGSAMGGLFRAPGSDVTQGFLWTEAGGFETLPDRPNGSRFSPVQISSGGLVVIAAGGDIWTPGSGFLSLDELAGVTGTAGNPALNGGSVSTDGNTIVGSFSGSLADGPAYLGFVLTLDDPCPPDLNRDGSPDFFDLLVFVRAFNAGDFFADENLDGRLDFFDVQQYLASLSGGCQ